MKIVNLDHFVLTVKDIQKSKVFYEKIIGLPLIKERTTSDVVTFSCGNALLKLRKLSNDVGAIVADNLAVGDFDFCLETKSPIEDIVEEFKKDEIPIELDPVITHGAKGKMNSVYVRDPDGNLVEISSYND